MTKELWMLFHPDTQLLEVRQGEHFGFLRDGDMISVTTDQGPRLLIYHRGHGEILVYPA